MQNINTLFEHLLQLAANEPGIHEEATIIISDSPMFFEALTGSKAHRLTSTIKIPTIKKANNHIFAQSTNQFFKPPFNSQQSNYPLNAYYLFQSIKKCKIMIVFDESATLQPTLDALKKSMNNLLNLLKIVPNQNHNDLINSIGFVITSYNQIQNRDMVQVFKGRFHALWRIGTVVHEHSDIIKNILLKIFQANRYALCRNLQNMENLQRQSFINIIKQMPGFNIKDKLNQNLRTDDNFILKNTKQFTQFIQKKVLKSLLKNWINICFSTNKQEIDTMLDAQNYNLTLKTKQQNQSQKKGGHRFAKICKILSDFLNLKNEILEKGDDRKKIPLTLKLSLMLSKNSINPQTIAILEAYQILRQKIKQIGDNNLYLIDQFQTQTINQLVSNFKFLEQQFKLVKKTKQIPLSELNDIDVNLGCLITSVQLDKHNVIPKYRLQNLWSFKACIKLRLAEHPKTFEKKQKLKNLLIAYEFSKKCETFNRQHFNYIYQQMGNIVKDDLRYGLAIDLFKKGQCYWLIKQTYEIKFKNLNNLSSNSNPINFEELQSYILFLIQTGLTEQAKIVSYKAMQLFKEYEQRQNLFGLIQLASNSKREHMAFLKKQLEVNNEYLEEEILNKIRTVIEN